MMDEGDEDEIQMQISLNTHKKKPKNKKSGKKGSPRKQISGIAIDIEQDTEKVLKVANYQCKVQKVQFEELTHNRQQEQIKNQMPEENGNLIQIKEDYQFQSDIAEQQPKNSDPSFVQKQVNQKVDEVYQKLDKDQFVDENIQGQGQEILILKEDEKQNNEEISSLAKDAIEQGNKQQKISQFMPQSMAQNNQNKALKLNQEFDNINNEKLIEQNTINQSKVQNIQVQENIKIQVINVPQTQNKELQAFHQVLTLTPNTKKSLKSKKEARNKKNLQKNKIELNIKDEQQEQQLQEIQQGIQVESNICILNQNNNSQPSSPSQKLDEVQSTIKGVQENTTVMEIQSDYNQVLNKQIEQNKNNLSQRKEIRFIQMKQAEPMEGSGIYVQKADINKKEQGQQNKKINQQSNIPEKIQWEEQEVAFQPIQRKKINKERIKKNKKNKESIIYEQQIQVQMNIIEEKIGNDQSTAVQSQLQMDQNTKNIEDKEYVSDEQKSTNERQAEQINKQNNVREEGKQKSDRNEIKQQKQRTQQKSMHELSANNRQVMVSNLVSMMKTYNDKGITLMKERIQMMKEDISSRLIRKYYQQQKMRQKPINLAHYGQIIQENIKLKQEAILESALFSQLNQ